MHVAFVIVSIVLAVVFLGAGVSKITKQKQMVDTAAHLGFSVTQYQGIGALEVAAVVGLIVGLFWKPLGIAAAIGLVLMMIGALVFHAKAKDGPKIMSAPALLGIVALVDVIFGFAS
ncbi:MAG: DoxX family protein [Actinomycetota bacterium]|nr:DoxX family protein [Actinomycetota bacterium]